MDGGACQATVHGVAELDMTETLQFHFFFFHAIVVKTSMENFLQVFM